MAVTVVVGGQFGSEGKGKVAYHFAKEKRASIAIRVGGSNSGHTVIDSSGTPVIFRVLPTAALLDKTICVLGAGCYIDADILFHEIEIAKIPAERVWIDPNAYVVSADHKQEEQDWGLGRRIGSTQSGTGAAIVERVKRLSADHLAKNNERLRPFTRPVRSLLRSHLSRGANIVVEGTQGFGLSLLHSLDYPKATSRDTTAATFVAEAGLSPLDVTEVILVIRAFPIRVPGDSGPLPNAIDWDTIAQESGSTSPLIEFTSVTKKVRRVARFDPVVVNEAIEANRPTSIVINHLDYIDASCVASGAITPRIESFLEDVEKQIKGPITHLGFDRSSVVTRPPVRKRIAQIRG